MILKMPYFRNWGIVSGMKHKVFFMINEYTEALSNRRETFYRLHLPRGHISYRIIQENNSNLLYDEIKENVYTYKKNLSSVENSIINELYKMARALST